MRIKKGQTPMGVTLRKAGMERSIEKKYEKDRIYIPI